MLALQAYKKPATSRHCAERLQARYQFYQLNGLAFLPLTGKKYPGIKNKTSCTICRQGFPYRSGMNMFQEKQAASMFPRYCCKY